MVKFLRLMTLLLAISLMAPHAMAGLLREGMVGENVRVLQENLNQAGYQVKVDGVFGRETTRAIRQLQADINMVVDGVVGPRTMEALRALTDSSLHLVQRGDSLYVLAQKYGTDVALIRQANDLSSNVIRVGDILIIPRVLPASEKDIELVSYIVRSGDTLSVIARRHGTTVEEIQELNEIPKPDLIQVGQLLTVPRGAEDDGKIRFIWPTVGRISSPYGWRTHPVTGRRDFHGGIDIAVGEGTPIRAAASGVVTETAWMGGAGRVVVVDHGSGITTWYLHLSSYQVKPGDRVRQGDVLALSGSSGVVTGPHLDFRIKIDGKTVNPMDWLPSTME